MKNFSTGTGLVALSAAILGSTIIMRFGSADQAAHAAPPMEVAKAIAAASTAQVTPTIVWYGVSGDAFEQTIIRAWSDGRVEATAGAWRIDSATQCNAWRLKVPGNSAPICGGPWQVVCDPNQGFNAAADINFDSKVDGSDLGQLLASWGDAPRQDIPPSDCPLNLINPR